MPKGVDTTERLSSFSERLVEAMDAKKVSPSRLGKATGISPSVICAYRKGRVVQPSLKTVYTLASALKVNYKWLNGEEGESMLKRQPPLSQEELEKLSERERKHYNLSIFSKRLVEAMEIRGLNQAELGRLTNLGSAAIHSYRKGRISAPNIKTLGLLSGALKVNYRWLRGDAGEPMERFPSESAIVKEDQTASRCEELEEQELREKLEEVEPTTFSAYLDRMLPLLCHFMEDRQKERAAFIECFKEYAKLDEADKAEIRGEMRQMLKAEKYR